MGFCEPPGLSLQLAQKLDTFGSSCRITNTPPKVCKIMALMAVIMGLGLLFYILLGFRYCSRVPLFSIPVFPRPYTLSFNLLSHSQACACSMPATVVCASRTVTEACCGRGEETSGVLIHMSHSLNSLKGGYI